MVIEMTQFKADRISPQKRQYLSNSWQKSSNILNHGGFNKRSFYGNKKMRYSLMNTWEPVNYLITSEKLRNDIYDINNYDENGEYKNLSNDENESVPKHKGERRKKLNDPESWPTVQLDHSPRKLLSSETKTDSTRRSLHSRLLSPEEASSYYRKSFGSSRKVQSPLRPKSNNVKRILDYTSNLRNGDTPSDHQTACTISNTRDFLNQEEVVKRSELQIRNASITADNEDIFDRSVPDSEQLKDVVPVLQHQDKNNIEKSSHVEQDDKLQKHIETEIASGDFGVTDGGILKDYGVSGEIEFHSTSDNNTEISQRSPQTRNECAALRIRKPYEIGFPNTVGSNICWMNSTLQILMGMKSLIMDLQAAVIRNHQSTILCSLLEVLKLRSNGSVLPLNRALSQLKNALGALDSAFSSDRQQDAPEFLVQLLDNFREEFYIIRSDKAEDTPLKEIQLDNILTPPSIIDCKSNPICTNIQFRLKETYTCTSCGAETAKGQDHLLLYVDIPSESESDTPSLQNALDQYMKTDSRERTCSNCGGQHCKVDTSFWQLPRFLIIQVKRYICLNTITLKLTTSLAIPQILSVKSYVESDIVLPRPWSPPKKLRKLSSAGDTSGSESVDLDTSTLPEAYETATTELKFSYHLTGVLSHHGDKPNAGHYVSDVYNYDAHDWYHYDDEHVQMVQDDDIGSNRQETGYLFVYTHRPLHNALNFQKTTSNSV